MTHPHVFRKTGLQSAWIGDNEIDRRVAEDAGVGKKVMMTHYVRVLREKSNRTFHRILEGLPAEVLERFGHVATDARLEEKLQAALAAKDVETVARLAAELVSRKSPTRERLPLPSTKQVNSCEIL